MLSSFAGVAQSVEQLTRNEQVRGSNPLSGSTVLRRWEPSLTSFRHRAYGTMRHFIATIDDHDTVARLIDDRGAFRRCYDQLEHYPTPVHAARDRDVGLASTIA